MYLYGVSHEKSMYMYLIKLLGHPVRLHVGNDPDHKPFNKEYVNVYKIIKKCYCIWRSFVNMRQERSRVHSGSVSSPSGFGCHI